MEFHISNKTLKVHHKPCMTFNVLLVFDMTVTLFSYSNVLSMSHLSLNNLNLENQNLARVDSKFLQYACTILELRDVIFLLYYTLNFF